MTRRSFCFLFGAGIAAAVAAPKLLSFSGYFDDLTDVTRIRPDASVRIASSTHWPTIATFKSRDLELRLGQSVTVEFNGQTFFSGKVSSKEPIRDDDGVVEYTAHEHAFISPHDWDAMTSYHKVSRRVFDGD